MTAWAFTLVYNESIIIPYWVRHYRSFCERVTVYVDPESDDGTAEIAEREGAIVLPYEFGPSGMDDFAFINFAHETYREARGHADWVVWTDADEIVYHPRIADRLAEYTARGVNLPRTEGFSMLSHHPPTGPGQIYDEIKRGIPASEYSKVALVNPQLDIEWTAGKHDASTIGGLAITRDDGADPIKLLHYRWLGEEYFLNRNQRNHSRQDEVNLNAGHGKECLPGFTGKFSPAWYVGQTEVAQECL